MSRWREVVRRELDRYQQQTGTDVIERQQDPNRDVLATLYFTTPEVPYEFEWDSKELDGFHTEISNRIDRELATTMGFE